MRHEEEKQFTENVSSTDWSGKEHPVMHYKALDELGDEHYY